MPEEIYKREKLAGRLDKTGIYFVEDDLSTSDIKDFPDYTDAVNGQFLRVVDGKLAWVSVPSAEDYAF